MNLPLFRSKAGAGPPNLVGIQDPALNAILPTVLVCPLVEGAARTGVRSAITWGDREFTVMCDLACPIRRSALTEVGQLGPRESREIVETFLRLLPR